MKPPEAIQFRKEDYPSTGLSTGPALDGFFGPLNRALAVARDALTQGLSIADNCNFEVRTVTVRTPSDDLVYPGIGSGPAFASGNFTTAANIELGFSKRPDGWAEFSGGWVSIGAAVPVNNDLVFTMPATYWPAKTVHVRAITRDGANNDVFASVGVNTTGQVRLRNLGTWYANSILGLGGAYPCADRRPVPLSCFPVDLELQRVRAPLGVGLLMVRDTSNALASPQAEPPLALGELKSIMLGPTRLRLQNLPGLLLGKTYELTIVAYT